MTSTKITIASDHAGYSLKTHLVEFIQKNYPEIEITDFGCDNSTDSVHYPDLASLVCNSINQGNSERGILICGSGVGMSIAANRHKGIRASLCNELLSARLTRQHNNSNVLCLGNWLVTPKLAEEIFAIWFKTEYEGGRHQIRIELLG
ncbi:MAG: ribose 5-phosphate isomerase B [Candidatus Melainabacteria bacterium]|jgi:ribose 5-phosphate isomerase B